MRRSRSAPKWPTSKPAKKPSSNLAFPAADHPISGFIANHPQKQCHYNAAKGGVNTLTKCLAYEWAEHNVRVNAIAPGWVATPLLKAADKKLLDEWAARSVQKRMADPTELKGVAVFLASQAASYVTGHILVVDGGYTIW
jgi:NAD(P)-dependent dehydrogenase (short-subunit alcohol dehydrogenase family)